MGEKEGGGAGGGGVGRGEGGGRGRGRGERGRERARELTVNNKCQTCELGHSSSPSPVHESPTEDPKEISS